MFSNGFNRIRQYDGGELLTLECKFITDIPYPVFKCEPSHLPALGKYVCSAGNRITEYLGISNPGMGKNVAPDHFQGRRQHDIPQGEAAVKCHVAQNGHCLRQHNVF